jgi:hypothetical protein
MKKAMGLFTFLFTVAAFMPAGASTSNWVAQRRLDRSVTALDGQSSQPRGAQIVTERLSKEFGVTDVQIKELRAKRLGFGEIAIVLSLAKQMPGGATDTNIQKVLALRQTNPPTGWGVVAKKLGLNFGKAVSRVHRIATQLNLEHENAANGAGKAQEKADKWHGSDEAAKADWSDRPERAEHIGRPERLERPEAMGRR